MLAFHRSCCNYAWTCCQERKPNFLLRCRKTLKAFLIIYGIGCALYHFRSSPKLISVKLSINIAEKRKLSLRPKRIIHLGVWAMSIVCLEARRLYSSISPGGKSVIPSLIFNVMLCRYKPYPVQRATINYTTHAESEVIYVSDV